MEEILNQTFWGNPLMVYAITALGMFTAWVVLKLTRRRVFVLLHKLTARTHSKFDDLLVEIAEKFIIPYLYLFINYNIFTQLNFTPGVERIITGAFMFVTIYYAIRLINFTIHRGMVKYMEQKKEPAERITQVSGMLIVVKLITWGMGMVMLFDNLGYNVTTIVAGLGVGGIAIALAAQNILGDLFSYFVIFFDKPFEIGDFITVDKNSGIVEKIGIKTSHIRSLDGQQLVMPNAEMVKSVIHNFKRLQRRRVIFHIGVVYNTASVKLRNIPRLFEDIILKQEFASFDRAHLQSFGDFSINYEIVYYIESADYLTYMNTHHEICLDIFEQFEKEKIEFAFPSQTIFLNRQNSDSTNEINNGLVAKQI